MKDDKPLLVIRPCSESHRLFAGDALRRREQVHDRVEGRNGARAPGSLHRPNHSGRGSSVRVRVPLQAVQEDRPDVRQPVLHRIRIRQAQGWSWHPG